MSVSFPSSKSIADESFVTLLPHSEEQSDCHQDVQLEPQPNLHATQERTHNAIKRALSPSSSPYCSHESHQTAGDGSRAKLKKTSKEEDVSASRAANQQVALLKPLTYVRRSQNNLILKLSVNLLKTYNAINDHYFARKKAQAKAASNPLVVPTTLEGRMFKLSMGFVTLGKVIGEGTYGVVHEGIYQPDGPEEAIKVAFKVNKVVQSKSKSGLYRQSIVSEVDFYKSVKQVDREGNNSIAELVDDGAIGPDCHCLVQKLYSVDLYQGLKKNHHRGFSLLLTAKIAMQLFQSLSLLRHPSINRIHADLKPENIVLNDGKTCKIRIIDFGSARAPSHNPKPGAYICSRYYRPPEIVLRLPFDHSFDIWSVGCILFELHTGYPLFPAQNEKQLISMICEFLGVPSEDFVKTIPNWQRFFAQSVEDPNKYELIGDDPYLRSPLKESRKEYFDRILSSEALKSRKQLLELEMFHNDETYPLFKDFIGCVEKII